MVIDAYCQEVRVRCCYFIRIYCIGFYFFVWYVFYKCKVMNLFWLIRSVNIVTSIYDEVCCKTVKRFNSINKNLINLNYIKKKWLNLNIYLCYHL